MFNAFKSYFYNTLLSVTPLSLIGISASYTETEGLTNGGFNRCSFDNKE
jgi:hypothetical protein